MKKVLLVLVLLGLMMACKADQKMPAKVKAAFDQKYEEATEVKWESLDDDVQISFEHDEAVKVAIFKVDGTWMKTTTTIETSMIPECIIDTISIEYSDSSINQAELIETPESSIYEVTIESEEEEVREDEESTEKKQKYLTLMFNGECNFLGEK